MWILPLLQLKAPKVTPERHLYLYYEYDAKQTPEQDESAVCESFDPSHSEKVQMQN